MKNYHIAELSSAEINQINGGYTFWQPALYVKESIDFYVGFVDGFRRGLDRVVNP
ncbi:hypothetical protein JM83_1601 [Gillisia sp. Hel_I_86]|uniref:hypothetical protein n=1 Tax=Gillisia sp. Hel_I_86 TaxID=1249981 RepID=UPI00119BF1DD|nr:hypothetical protein [Gillisia sp. Hel_I_86]TVZ26621.1 hypothetical protein JM83_1601 [Gillisia sp. Hel_I_86]